MSRIALFALFLCTFVFSWGAFAARTQAQFRRPTETVGMVAPMSTSPDAASLSQNPASIAELSSWSLVYQGVIGETQRVPAGHSLSFATPLLFGVSIGGDLVVRATPTYFGDVSGALALAWSGSRSFSLGTTLRFFGPTAGLGEHVAFDVGAHWRASTLLSLSVVMRDVFGPMQAYVDNARVPMSAIAMLGLRPWSDRRLTLEAGVGASTDGRVGTRAAMEATLPYIGRLRVAGELEDIQDRIAEWTLSAGLVVDWARIGAGGGVLVEDGDQLSATIYARAEGADRPGIPSRRYMLDMEIASLGPRGLVRLAQLLDRVRTDDAIAGVRLRPRSTGIGSAIAQELRLQISTLRASGKRVICHLEAASGAELYACAAADAIEMDPAGGVRLVGTAIEVTHLRELLDNIGVHADFVRIGQYKSAPEQFTNNTMSEPARVAREALLDDVFARMTEDYAHDFDMTPASVRELIDNGPYIASEAREARIVDVLADVEDDDDARAELLGARYPLREHIPGQMAARWGRPDSIGVVVIDGDIVDGENVDIPLLGIHMSGGTTVVEAIDSLARDPSIRAIVVRIDSPGGSALASDQIYRAIVRARRRKPVIASMGAVAASGGYYAAAATQEIWCNPSTVTGSIGVFFGKVDVTELASRIGVNTELLGRGRRASVESMWRPFTQDERTMLERKVEQWYGMFLDRVAEGRHMSRDEVDAVAQGRIWSGDAARSRGLVDRLGGFASAVARARELAGVSDDAGVVVLPRRPETLLDYVLAEVGASAGANADEAALNLVPVSLRRILGQILTIDFIGGDTPMARMPYDVQVQ